MLINKESLPLVAMEFMNAVHLEDVDIINKVFELILIYENNPLQENKQKLTNVYKEWINHTIKHFKGEEIMMEEKQFPPYHVHKREHQYALNKMNEIFQKWETTQDIQVLKIYFIEELIPWLTKHIQTMDTVTAMFLKTNISPCAMQH
jgi:hemerythrin